MALGIVALALVSRTAGHDGTDQQRPAPGRCAAGPGVRRERTDPHAAVAPVAADRRLRFRLRPKPVAITRAGCRSAPRPIRFSGASRPRCWTATSRCSASPPSSGASSDAAAVRTRPRPPGDGARLHAGRIAGGAGGDGLAGRDGLARHRRHGPGASRPPARLAPMCRPCRPGWASGAPISMPWRYRRR